MQRSLRFSHAKLWALEYFKAQAIHRGATYSDNFNEYVYISLFIIFLKGKYYIKAKLLCPITEIICCIYFSVSQKQVFLLIFP